ncbi:hypothetical protein SUGI_0561320 [Cryptomeria japonica]|uniref:lipase-like PAD4 isoform X2 n=1 Tax=Cryptomeria japonica TaxID=3369 RepID=UPI002408A02B|nr:lipase-like PAD4 isoform X2 [Cryptomeria japonica]GLJ28530.1 hypothetical protein SUGI_0561320 [Cryptomeria japonica]
MGLYLDYDSCTPQFTTGQETASFLCSCGILDQSWNEIHDVYTKNVGTFLLKSHEGVLYVAFSVHYMEARDGRDEECDLQIADTVLYPSLKGDDGQQALVHKGAFNRFRYFLNNTDLNARLQGLQEQVIVFVGHSIGGAVATLATIWFLEKRMKNPSPFCITFGSPLVGDVRLGEAIARQDWCGRFCHVVSQHDIVPRMLLAPIESIAEPLNVLLPHWRSTMGIESATVSDLPIQKASKALLKKVLECTESPGSPYIPSGIYMFCSMNGVACIDASEAVLKMLHYTMLSDQGWSFDRIAGACISEHTGYGEFLEDIAEDMTKYLQNAKKIASVVQNSSFEMGIALELEAIGIGSQNNRALTVLRKAGEMKKEQDTNIDKLNFQLSERQSNMAQLEWYKLCCSDLGYYDAFKEKFNKRDIDANLIIGKLASFWDEIVEMVDKHQLPSDFQSQNKWINAGNAHRKLVEPLEIANYYQKGGNSGNYLSAGVRPHRHEVLEKWLNDKNQTRTGRERRPRTKFASLTEDSCFWAHVEEALKTLQHQVLNATQIESLEKFEDYLGNMIENRSISAEIFLEGSTFIKWWQQYRELRHQSQQWQARSPLFNFMDSRGWETVGI